MKDGVRDASGSHILLITEPQMQFMIPTGCARVRLSKQITIRSDDKDWGVVMEVMF